MNASQNQDHYTLLGLLPRGPLSPEALKVAYRAALLRTHPDKTRSTAEPEQMDAIREAYATLSDPARRAAYDRTLAPSSGPRPAQMSSLADFKFVPDTLTSKDVWTHACRCGGTYKITEDEMENEVHLVGCSGCSEIVSVGYEVFEGDEEEVG